MAYISRHQVLGIGNMMEQLNYNLPSKTAPNGQSGASIGVVNSGNLEILLLNHENNCNVKFTVITSVAGYSEIWHAVVSDFASKFAIGGLEFILHDSGATPAIVALRLRQAYEAYLSASADKDITNSHYVELTPRERIIAIVDEGSFKEILPPLAQVTSPHLAQLNLLTSFDDGVVIGDAMLDGKEIAVIAQQANFIGGAVGEVNGAKIAGMCLRALKRKVNGVILLLDSGGVRLQEANAGEIAISEIIRSIFALRLNAIPVIAVVAGKNGAFGGIGITATCADSLFISEQGRSGVSGPEVIETVMGVDEYDSKDRALVWRTCGGKHRSLLGLSKYAIPEIAELRQQIKNTLNNKVVLNVESLRADNLRLAELLTKYTTCHDALDIWRDLGVKNPEQVPDLTDMQFIQLQQSLAE